MRRSLFAGIGGVGAAVLGILCCIGAPLLLALGIGSGFVASLGVFRPVFGALTVTFLAGGFYMLHRDRAAKRSRPAGIADSADDRSVSRSRLVLWIATGLALVLWVLPLLLGSAAGMHR